VILVPEQVPPEILKDIWTKHGISTAATQAIWTDILAALLMREDYSVLAQIGDVAYINGLQLELAATKKLLKESIADTARAVDFMERL
jgi:hypothetical protein